MSINLTILGQAIAFALFVGDVIGPVEKEYNKEYILQLANDWKNSKMKYLDVKHAFGCPREEDEKPFPSNEGSCHKCFTESYFAKAKLIISALNETKLKE